MKLCIKSKLEAGGILPIGCAALITIPNRLHSNASRSPNGSIMVMPGIVGVHDVDVGKVTKVSGERVALIEIDDVDVTMDVESVKEVGSASLVGSVDTVPIALVESVVNERSVADCTESQHRSQVFIVCIHRPLYSLPQTVRMVEDRFLWKPRCISRWP